MVSFNNNRPTSSQGAANQFKNASLAVAGISIPTNEGHILKLTPGNGGHLVHLTGVRTGVQETGSECHTEACEVMVTTLDWQGKSRLPEFPVPFDAFVNGEVRRNEVQKFTETLPARFSVNFPGKIKAGQPMAVALSLCTSSGKTLEQNFNAVVKFGQESHHVHGPCDIHLKPQMVAGAVLLSVEEEHVDNEVPSHLESTPPMAAKGESIDYFFVQEGW
jgi:hypothetical protein